MERPEKIGDAGIRLRGRLGGKGEDIGIGADWGFSAIFFFDVQLVMYCFMVS